MDVYRNVQFDGGLKCFLGLRSQRAGAMHCQFPTPQNKSADRGNPAAAMAAGFFLFPDGMEHGGFDCDGYCLATAAAKIYLHSKKD